MRMPIHTDDIRICLEDQPAREPGIEPMATPIVQTSLFAFPDASPLWVPTLERRVGLTCEARRVRTDLPTVHFATPASSSTRSAAAG